MGNIVGEIVNSVDKRNFLFKTLNPDILAVNYKPEAESFVIAEVFGQLPVPGQPVNFCLDF